MRYQPKTLVELVRCRADSHPTRGYRFLNTEGTVSESLDYAEIDRAARSLAVTARGRGVRPGDRALLVFPPGLDFVRAFWACAYAGIVAVPTPSPHAARLPRVVSRLRSIACDCSPSVVLTSSLRIGAIREALARTPELANVALIETDLADDDPSMWTAPNSKSDDATLLQYTSGSTRDPRGVIISHANLLHNLGMLKEFHLAQDDMVMISWLPLHHDMGLIRAMMSPLHMGGDCFLMAPMDFVQDPSKWLAAVTRHSGTTTGAPNFGFELCVRRIDDDAIATLDLSSLRVAFCSAEPIRKHTVDRFIGRFSRCGFRRSAFRPAYGLAEATVMVTGETGDGPTFVRVSESKLREGRVTFSDEGESDLASCGRPLGEQEVVIVGEDQQRCPIDRLGEVWLRGPSVGRGYWEKEEETEKTFDAQLADGTGPFLRTGDLGFLTPGGGLCIVGRIRDLIIVRGQKYFPHDLEATIEQAAPSLRAGCSAAFGIDGEGTQAVVIVCEFDGNKADADFEELVNLIRGAVGEEYDLGVDGICVLAKGMVPKTTSGKVQRSLARSLYLAGKLDPLHTWVARRDLHEKVQSCQARESKGRH